MFQCCKLIIILNKWRDKARYKNKKRENELVWNIGNLIFLKTEFCCYIAVASYNDVMYGEILKP